MKTSPPSAIFLIAAAFSLSTQGVIFGVSNFIAFGDSLSDTGNAFAATGGLAAGSPYYMGRFSNGPIWIDCVATSLGHDIDASAVGGDNWSVGGATAGGVGNTFTAQVSTYLSTTGGVADSDALYSTWIGGNDVNDALTSATPIPDLTAALGAYQADLTSLFGAGANQFLIPNLPDLGATPGAIAGGPAAVAGASALTSYWNAGVAGIISGLRAAGATVFAPDIFTESADIFANPGTYGFTNSTDGAFLVGAADPNDYVFVDTLHPSAPAHKLLAGIMLQSIPEPSRAILVFAGLAVSVLRRRR